MRMLTRFKALTGMRSTELVLEPGLINHRKSHTAAYIRTGVCGWVGFCTIPGAAASALIGDEMMAIPVVECEREYGHAKCMRER